MLMLFKASHPFSSLFTLPSHTFIWYARAPVKLFYEYFTEKRVSRNLNE